MNEDKQSVGNNQMNDSKVYQSVNISVFNISKPNIVQIRDFLVLAIGDYPVAVKLFLNLEELAELSSTIQTFLDEQKVAIHKLD